MNKVSEKSEASTHGAGIIRVQVGVLESNCGAGDVHAATLQAEGTAQFNGAMKWDGRRSAVKACLHRTARARVEQGGQVSYIHQG